MRYRARITRVIACLSTVVLLLAGGRAFAASACPSGTSTLDCQAILGGWQDWVPITGSCYSGSSLIPGSDNVQKAFNYFRGSGFSDAEAAAIVGNLMQESGVDPEDGKGSGSEGIAQWTGSRLQNLKDTDDPYSLDTQLQFLLQELTGGDYSPVAKNLKQQSTVPNAVGYFMGTSSLNQIFKNPDGSTSSAGKPYMDAVIAGDPSQDATFSSAIQAEIDGGYLKEFVNAHGYVAGYENPGAPNMAARVKNATAVFQKFGNGSVSGIGSSCGGAIDCNSSSSSASQLRQTVVCEAKAELALWDSGQMQPGNDVVNKYLKPLGRSIEAWCADFISWLYTQAGRPTNNASSVGFETLSGFTFHPGTDYIPQPGDLAIYANGDGSGHVDLVVSYNSSNGSVELIGGDLGGDDGNFYMTSKVNDHICNFKEDNVCNYVNVPFDGYASPNE